MHEASQSFSESARQLKEFIACGVHPATRHLQQLDQTLARLAETVRAIQDFSAARQDIERLNGSLGKAACVSEAIGGLPDQIRTILEDIARSHQQQLESRAAGGMTAWLLGRR
jgi:hypothetical protein